MIGAFSRPVKISATRKSFQIHMNWKIASAAIAGTDSGTISRQKIVMCPAPSTRAASMMSLGSDDTKFLRMKMQNGMPKHTWANHTP